MGLHFAGENALQRAFLSRKVAGVEVDSLLRLPKTYRGPTTGHFDIESKINRENWCQVPFKFIAK